MSTIDVTKAPVADAPAGRRSRAAAGGWVTGCSSATSG